MAYLTAAALRLVLPDAGTATADDDALDAIIARASQVVDGYCGRTWTVATSAADRIFYGTGTPKLRIDWADDTITSGDVALPTGWTLPEFVEVRNTAADYLALQIVDADGFKLPSTVDYAPYVWTEGIPVTINAAWGYAAIPGDVVEATAIIATARWRETYVGALENWQGDVGRNYEIPPNAREILDRLRLASTFTVGGLF